jgi:4-hydroxyproline epimerase
MAERRRLLQEDFDEFRTAVVGEPRGSDVMVGALLCEPVDPACAAGVIFFNNVGYLGMCGHGAIGLTVTLAHLGRISPGEHCIETPAGEVTAILEENGEVTINNVLSYRTAREVAVNVEGHGLLHGDVAWGGNWFFLVSDHDQEIALRRVEQLTEFTWRIRQALQANGITGDNGREIDHIELFAPPARTDADSRNFVLCPGRAYDRSPCGTGTSAKLACLAAEGKLGEGDVWRQEGIVGSLFEGTVLEIDGDQVLAAIRGSAHVNAEATLILDPKDPFCMGIRK